MEFAKNLKNFLSKHNLSLIDLPDQLEVLPSTVYGWLNDVPPKSIKTLKKVALLLNGSINENCFDNLKISEYVESNINLTIGKITYRIVLKKNETGENV